MSSETETEIEIIALSTQAKNILDDGGKPLLLTPDDILTLKLLRDRIAQDRIYFPDEKHRPLDSELTLETLERILKQVV